MNLLAIGLSLLLGLARGRRLCDLTTYSFGGAGLFIVALALQVILGTPWAEAHQGVRAIAALINLTSMGLVLGALALNWELRGARIAFVAVLLNFAVVFANGGKMPVSAETLRAADMPASRLAYLTAGHSLTHRLMRPDTNLACLGDIYYLPSPVARSPAFSLGDMILTLALFVIVQEVMTRGLRLRQAVLHLSRAAAPGEADEGELDPADAHLLAGPEQTSDLAGDDPEGAGDRGREPPGDPTG